MQKLGNMSIYKGLWLAVSVTLSTAFAGSVMAQGLFDPVVYVNDDVVTEFEVEQRTRFLSLLNAPGANRDAVIEELVDERLRGQAIEAAGLAITPEGLENGMSEFAARANLETDEFLAFLVQNGVAEETLKDFVSVGVAWRDLIRGRFGRRLEITEAEIDRALGSSNGASGIRVLVSEIIIPAPPERRAEVDTLAQQIAASTSEAEFSQYARDFSATASRDAGGRLPWQALTNLPAALRPLLLGLAPGDITDPIAIPNAVALFQLRDIQETGATEQEFSAIDYAAYYLPGGRTPATLRAAEALRDQVDVCDDLFGIAQGQPEEALDRVVLPPAEIEQDIAFELSKLDPGEVSTALTRTGGQTLMFLMMCGRTAAVNQEVAREDAAAALRSRTLNTFAESLLAQLRADASIRFP